MQNRNKLLTANTIIIIINVLVFAAEFALGGSLSDNIINETCTMYTPYVLEGQVWRMFTSMFLHFGAAHIFMNMMALYNIGYFLESYIGTKKYILTYVLGGLCGNLFVLGIDLLTGSSAYGAGASGAIFAVLGAILCIALKDKRSGLSVPNLISSVIFALLPGFVIPGISWSAHLGGLIGGFLIALIMVRKRN